MTITHNLPDAAAVDDRELAAGIERYTALVTRRVDAGGKVGAEQDAAQQAIGQDRQAAADAVRAGKPLPSDKALRAQMDRLHAAERELEVVEQALADEGDAFVQLVRERRAGYTR